MIKDLYNYNLKSGRCVQTFIKNTVNLLTQERIMCDKTIIDMLVCVDISICLFGYLVDYFMLPVAGTF